MRERGGQILTLGLVLAIVAVAGSTLFGADGIARLLQLRQLRQQLGEAAMAGLRENEGLLRRVRALRDDPQVIEREARRQLGLVRPDEVVYRFEPRPTSPR